MTGQKLTNIVLDLGRGDVNCQYVTKFVRMAWLAGFVPFRKCLILLEKYVTQIVTLETSNYSLNRFAVIAC